MKFLILVVCVLGVVCKSPPKCEGMYNAHEINMNEPVEVRRVPHGIRMHIEGSDIPLVHVEGTPYQMGYAMGQLLKEEATNLVDEVLNYFLNLGYEFVLEKFPLIEHIPKDWLFPIARFLALKVADLNYLVVRHTIPNYFIEEMKGLGDGSGLGFWMIVELAMIPEISKAQCTILGAWGPATEESLNGKLIQARALDWTVDGPFQKFQAIIVYHPDQGHEFAILTFPGFTGALTGMSATMGISEKVWINTTMETSRIGYPFPFMMRDIIQFDQTRFDAVTRMKSIPRTCTIFLGVGDSVTDEMTLVEYGYGDLHVYSDKNFTEWDTSKNGRHAFRYEINSP
jgi:isopenicillin-N N-acyltransferase like protein